MWVLWCHIQWKPNVMLWCSYSLRRRVRNGTWAPDMCLQGKEATREVSVQYLSNKDQVGTVRYDLRERIWHEVNHFFSGDMVCYLLGLDHFHGIISLRSIGSDESWKLGCLWHHATSMYVTSTKRMENTALSPVSW